LEKHKLPDRRGFLRGMAAAAGLTVAGGVLWGGHLDKAKASLLVLRPPGALDEERFLALCAKCGLCVADCPYDSLRLATPDDEVQIGTPYFVARQRPCYMCSDIPCAAACPTGALDLGRLKDENSRRPDIVRARIGLAHIDTESCIAYWGLRCDVCYRVCPLIDKAIVIQSTRNDRTGHHAFLAPVVDSEHCTGCGICEHVCVNDRASINVLPLGIAQGESNARYMRGWREDDESLLDAAPGETTTKTPRSSSSPSDYLNEGL
jgi:ferredoxin-type protein NapG